MHFLPLLDQNAQPVKAFDEAGCQTSPPPSERALGPDSSTQVDFMSFEDFDNLLLGLDPTATSAPPTYSDAVTQNDSSFPLGLGLGLDQNTLVSGSSLRTSAATPACVGAAVPKHPDETFARPQKIDHLLNPVPRGIYMRARPMIWDAASSAASPSETERLVNDAHRPQSYAHLDMKSSGLPPWRRPSIAHVAFQTAPVDLGDVFGPYPKSLAPEFDAGPRHHVPRSLTYPPPPIPHPSSYLGPNAGIDSWAEHTPSKNAPPPTYAMPDVLLVLDSEVSSSGATAGIFGSPHKQHPPRMRGLLPQPAPIPFVQRLGLHGLGVQQPELLARFRPPFVPACPFFFSLVVDAVSRGN
ncbi:hypothetical protein GSI_09786 [Ganoderma sinense ZZ0214-1]|uniref:Uncharacterized protein n=1 Tax=Ganoderma sinense ZZ0214-1 TaxID=1077348 RepID=A0A2G8S2Y7_9APHY|nr:hypothetical protein GSI_09786 [Ganoderma sinense ZZ0214-1]